VVIEKNGLSLLQNSLPIYKAKKKIKNGGGGKEREGTKNTTELKERNAAAEERKKFR